MGMRELVALFCLSSWCLVIVVWLFLTMPPVCLQFVIVVFPDHSQYFCHNYKLCQYGMLLKSQNFDAANMRCFKFTVQVKIDLTSLFYTGCEGDSLWLEVHRASTFVPKRESCMGESSKFSKS